MFRVTVAIVTYRSKGELPACLESLLASDLPARIVIIDNDSNDGTLELAQEYARKHPNIIAFSSGGNIGLAAANNLVLPYAEGEYILILNPDTVVQPDTLSVLVGILDANPKVGVVGPKNVNEDGSPFTSYQRSWNLGHVVLWRVLPYSFTRKLYDSLSSYNESEVFFVSGACLLIRTSVFREIGGYDPAYFLTIEDVCDLCRRVRERGYSVVFTPRTQLVHLCSRSGDQVPYLATLENYKGSIYYFTKYNGRLGGYLAYALVTFGCALKILMSVCKLALWRRPVDRRNLRVYLSILPELLQRGPRIAYSAR